MLKIYRVSEAVEILGVCTKTILRWDKSGLIICFRTIGGYRRISIAEIEKITNNDSIRSKYLTDNSTAVYCRVSSHDQKKKGDLERQISASVQHCNERGIKNPLIFKDVASGLNPVIHPSFSY
ncbi:MAG: IS607 family transposase [Promethearchaeota archaeon]